MFCNIPTSYSYWCSHLNQTTHIAQSSNHFPYSVALGTKGYTVSRLCTQVRLPKPQVCYTFDSLYPTFVVYLTTIHRRISLSVSLLTPERIIQFSKNDFGRFRTCFTKLRLLFLFVKYFVNFFFDSTTSIFHPLLFQTFYKVKSFILI